MFAKNEENNKQSDSVLKKRKCVIEDVILKKKAKAEPLFVTFANGRPQENASLRGTLHQNASTDRRRHNRRVFTVETPRLNYVGKNFGNDIRTPFANHTMFLGILDKATGKMRLVETSLFYARPLLETINATNPFLKKAAHSLTYEEKQEVMTSAFGTKQAKLTVNRRKQYQVNAQNMSVAIDQAATSVSAKAGELIADSQEEETLLAILPVCNREASSPADVYRLESITPDSLLVYLEESARQMLLEEKDTNPKSTILFGELLAVARLEEDEENQVRLACVALYVEYLLTFLRMKGKDLRDMKVKDKSLEGCPPKIKSHIMNEYTQLNHKQRFRSRQGEDSATCCALVLSLIVNKFQLSVNTLLQSLGIPRDKLNLLMKVIGATYMTQNYSYVLKIPLAKITKAFKKRRFQPKK